MKKALVAFALAALASSAMAAVSGTSHDLSGPGNKSVCQYCHAPHFANTSVSGTPLWNRALKTAGQYTPYSSTTLNDTTVVIGPNSLTCLSCHDGTLDLGATLRAPETLGTLAAGNYANVGTNLADDHPVGVNYPNITVQTDFVVTALITATGGLELYNGQVECASCHDPHGTAATGGGSDGITGGQSFLRVNLDTLCSGCHVK